MTIQNAIAQSGKISRDLVDLVGSLQTVAGGDTGNVQTIVDQLLTNIKEQGKIKHFSFLARTTPGLVEELKKATDKASFTELTVKLGQANGCKFTAEDVRNIPGSWNAYSEKELIDLLLNLSKGGLEEFLVDVQNKTELQKKLAEKTDKSFAERLVELGKENGKSFTLQDVEEVWIGIHTDVEPKKNYPVIGRIWS